jgi:hypothetical protein
MVLFPFGVGAAAGGFLLRPLGLPLLVRADESKALAFVVHAGGLGGAHARLGGQRHSATICDCLQ